VVQINNGSRTTYVYDAANELTNSQDSSGTTTYSYDATGNLTVQDAPSGRTTHTWDAENHLVLVQAPSSVINTMVYRADGLRVEKQDSSGISRFIWDSQNILLETDGDNASTCLYTLKPLAYGNLISQHRSDASHFYHFDALGSTQQLTDSSQSVTDGYLYEGHGKLLIASGTTVNPFRWVGMMGYFYDADILEYYIRARHYGHTLAKWFSKDPIGYLAGDDNLYRYVGNSVVNLVDPAGLQAPVCIYPFCTGTPKKCCPKDIEADNKGYLECLDFVYETYHGKHGVYALLILMRDDSLRYWDAQQKTIADACKKQVGNDPVAQADCDMAAYLTVKPFKFNVIATYWTALHVAQAAERVETQACSNKYPCHGK
jgi:RHS repeat-associated protein